MRWINPSKILESVETSGISHRRGETAGYHAFLLEVRKSNAAAIHLYEKMGFVSEGVRKNFYERPKEDAVIMWKREL